MVGNGFLFFPLARVVNDGHASPIGSDVAGRLVAGAEHLHEFTTSPIPFFSLSSTLGPPTSRECLPLNRLRLWAGPGTLGEENYCIYDGATSEHCEQRHSVLLQQGLVLFWDAVPVVAIDQALRYIARGGQDDGVVGRCLPSHVTYTQHPKPH